MRCIVRGAALAMVICAAALAGAQPAKHSVKVANTPPPKELAEPVRKLFGSQSIQYFDAQGKLIAEFWFRPEVPAAATPEQIKNGITYREVKQSEIIAAVRVEQTMPDYRKQNVRAGVYTLRLGYQPEDGDHAGTSPHQDFLVVIAADKDTKAELLDFKLLAEMSQKTINTGHPAVFMLFPNSKPAAEPQYVAKGNNHFAINTRADITVNGKKADGVLGIGLTVVGAAD